MFVSSTGEVVEPVAAAGVVVVKAAKSIPVLLTGGEGITRLFFFSCVTFAVVVMVVVVAVAVAVVDVNVNVACVASAV